MFIQKIIDVAESALAPLGYEVIDVESLKGGLIRIYVDVLDGFREINLKDCEIITKQLIYLFPVEGISFERLEVSSPGFDRKLTKSHHFERFLGAKVKLKFRDSVSGRKNFVGFLNRKVSTDKDVQNEKNFTDFVSSKNLKESSTFTIEEIQGKTTNVIEFEIDELEQARLVE